MSSGISEIGKTLQLTFGFEFQGWLRKKVREAMKGSDNKASLKLRDRVLKEAKVLPNDIVDVSAFMDSMVDVNLMDDCAKDLAKLFEETKPTKILTVATTGKCLEWKHFLDFSGTIDDSNFFMYFVVFMMD